MEVAQFSPLGLYIHIPYCLQRCHYCDFSTVLWNHKLPPDHYFQLLKQELLFRREGLSFQNIKTIYFGGGTPSLVDGSHIITFLENLSNLGVDLKSIEEVTIEIDPGTITPEKLDLFKSHGVNRFSVGIQTFDETLLKRLGRRHSTDNSRNLLQLLNERDLQFSVDLLFSLPEQTPQGLKEDLKTYLSFNPHHISTYYLTLPDKHPLQMGRPLDDDDVAMFDIVENALVDNGYLRYEISNFARPGFESRHNLVYWNDESYLGLGMSAHSYNRTAGTNGVRFWNTPTMEGYQKQVQDSQPWQHCENLSLSEALTDYCHISLRRLAGLNENAFCKKFGAQMLLDLHRRRDRLLQRGLVELTHTGFRLSKEGRRLANLAFAELTFVPEELSAYS